MRAFLVFAREAGHSVHICGQEKTGRFVDHLEGIARFASPRENTDPASVAILSHTT